MSYKYAISDYAIKPYIVELPPTREFMLLIQYRLKEYVGIASTSTLYMH